MGALEGETPLSCWASKWPLRDSPLTWPVLAGVTSLARTAASTTTPSPPRLPACPGAGGEV